VIIDHTLSSFGPLETEASDHISTVENIKKHASLALSEAGLGWVAVDGMQLCSQYGDEWFYIIVLQHQVTHEVRTVVYEDN